MALTFQRLRVTLLPPGHDDRFPLTNRRRPTFHAQQLVVIKCRRSNDSGCDGVGDDWQRRQSDRDKRRGVFQYLLNARMHARWRENADKDKTRRLRYGAGARADCSYRRQTITVNVPEKLPYIERRAAGSDLVRNPKPRRGDCVRKFYSESTREKRNGGQTGGKEKFSKTADDG